MSIYARAKEDRKFTSTYTHLLSSEIYHRKVVVYFYATFVASSFRNICVCIYEYTHTRIHTQKHMIKKKKRKVVLVKFWFSGEIMSSAGGKLLKIIILGAPGSGKGTISNRIVRDFGLGYFSVGDCLRDHMQRGTEVGVEAQRYIKAGTLVPDLVINQLVLRELRDRFANTAWLLDGYPRNRAQANELWSARDVRPNSVINLIVPDEEIIDRVRHRWIHQPSGRIYHNLYSPPKKPGVDDVTGEPLVQRDDDREEVVRARLRAFHAVNSEIVSMFRERQILADFSGTQSDVIYPQVKTHLDSLQQKFAT